MQNTNLRQLYLSPLQVKLLFAYYLCTLVSSFAIAGAIYIPGPFSIFSHQALAFIGAASMACLGSAVFYTRKLYKAVLSSNLQTEIDQHRLKASATFVYFFARPLFSIAFAIIIVIGTKSGLMLSSNSNPSLGYGFIQLNMFLAFFSGFLSGRFIKKLESWGEKVLDQITIGGTK